MYIPSGNQSEGESDCDFDEAHIPLADFVQSGVESMSDIEDSDSDDDQPPLSLMQTLKFMNQPSQKVSCAKEQASKTFQMGKEGPPVMTNTAKGTFADEQLKSPEAQLSPLEYFNIFLSDDMLENIAEQTNLYSV